MTRDELIREDLSALRLDQRVVLLLRGGGGISGTMKCVTHDGDMIQLETEREGKRFRVARVHADDIVAIEMEYPA